MKKLALILAALLAAFIITIPAIAASLGMSPSKVEVQVPADGSSTIAMKAYYYSGDIQVTMEDIPLRVSPETIHVDAVDNPQDFVITVYGDTSLGSKIYDGYIRFLGKSGDMIAVAVKVKAHVTNLVAGQEPVLVLPPATAAEVPQAAPEPTGTSNPRGQVAQVSPPETSPGGQSDVFAGISLNMVIFIAAGLVFVGLVILSISLSRRRRD
jgi:hypothetical protein